MSTWSKLQQIIVAQLEKQKETPIFPLETLLNCDIKTWEEVCQQNEAQDIELAILWMYFMEASDEKNIYLMQMNATYDALKHMSLSGTLSHPKITHLVLKFWRHGNILIECFGEVSESESLAA